MEGEYRRGRIVWLRLQRLKFTRWNVSCNENWRWLAAPLFEHLRYPFIRQAVFPTTSGSTFCSLRRGIEIRSVIVSLWILHYTIVGSCVYSARWLVSNLKYWFPTRMLSLTQLNCEPWMLPRKYISDMHSNRVELRIRLRGHHRLVLTLVYVSFPPYKSEAVNFF